MFFSVSPCHNQRHFIETVNRLDIFSIFGRNILRNENHCLNCRGLPILAASTAKFLREFNSLKLLCGKPSANFTKAKKMLCSKCYYRHVECSFETHFFNSFSGRVCQFWSIFLTSRLILSRYLLTSQMWWLFAIDETRTTKVLFGTPLPPDFFVFCVYHLRGNVHFLTHSVSRLFATFFCAKFSQVWTFRRLQCSRIFWKFRKIP